MTRIVVLDFRFGPRINILLIMSSTGVYTHSGVEYVLFTHDSYIEEDQRWSVKDHSGFHIIILPSLVIHNTFRGLNGSQRKHSHQSNVLITAQK